MLSKKSRPKEPGKTAIVTSNEPLVRDRISAKTKFKIFVTAFVILVLVIYVGWDVIFTGPLMQFISNREKLIESVKSLGIFGPLLYIVLQSIQIVVAPIPGQVVGSVGGFLFGGWGVLWTTIGSIIGYYIVLKIARHFGRPLIEKIFKKSAVDKFDFILNGQGTAMVIFAICLLPGFPDDMVCYLAGLTNLSIRKLMAIILLGRVPTIVLTNYFGAGIGGDNLALLAGIAVITVIVLGLAVWKRDWIMAKMRGKKKESEEKVSGKSHDENLKDSKDS